MAQKPRKLKIFFTDFMRQGDALPPDVRCLGLGDSTLVAGTSTDQGSYFDGMVGAFGIPVRADGGNPIVGLSANGPERSFGAGTLDRFITAGVVNSGWSTSVGRNPRSGYTTSDGQTVDVCPQQFTDLAIASGGTRTGYTADGNQTGIAMYCMFGAHVHNSTKTTVLATGFGPGSCPFTERQTHARWIGWGAGPTRGRADMRIQGIRAVAGQNMSSANWTLANIAFVGSKQTMDHSAAGGVLSYTADCGAGAGIPGLIIVNPDADSSGNNCTILSTGARVFRSDSGGNPITGVHMGCLGIGGNTIEDIGKMLGIGSSPYVTPAVCEAYLAEFIGAGTMGVNAGPTHVMVLVGHNYSSAEASACTAGDPAVYAANLAAVIQAIKARCLSLNNAVPEILILFAPAFRTSYSRLHMETAEAAAASAAASEDVSFLSLFDLTDTGGSSFSTLVPPYSRGAAMGSAAGTTSGPVPSGDYLHPSRWAQYVVARRIWEVGCEACGYQAISPLKPGPLPEVAVAGGRIRRGRWR